jgi:hypothetical protein
MIKLLFLINLLFISLPSIAWNENTNASPRSRAMGGAGVCLKDQYSLSVNQAAISSLGGTSFSSSFESRFINSGISNKSILISSEFNKLGTFGLAVNSFGLKNYTENKFGIAFARNFGERVSIGMQINYLSTVLGENYGKTGTISAELGFLAQITPNISVAAHLFNPTRAAIASKYNEFAPTVLKFGILYKLNSRLIFTSDAEKSSNVTKPVIKAGLEYNAIKGLFLRAGFSGNPLENSFGIGYHTGNLKTDLFVAFNSRIGYSSGIGIAYILKSKTKAVLSSDQP